VIGVGELAIYHFGRETLSGKLSQGTLMGIGMERTVSHVSMS
jgi:hypothetical protein